MIRVVLVDDQALFRAGIRMLVSSQDDMEVAGEASATMTANLDASNERAERIIAATAKLEARQLWSAAAAMCLALLPVVVVVTGLWMGIAGLITGAQWALDVDGSLWLGIGRWLVVAVGLSIFCSVFGVYASYYGGTSTGGTVVLCQGLMFCAVWTITRMRRVLEGRFGRFLAG